MQRRDFVAFISGAAIAARLAANAQQSTIRVLHIGIIDNAPIWEGKNIVMSSRHKVDPRLVKSHAP